MRILFLTHYFPPEVNAPASRTYEHARIWTEAGHDVTVVTCAPNHPRGVLYPGYANRCVQVEDMTGIRVIRVWTYLAANEGFLKRTANYLSFMLSSILHTSLYPPPDVVVSTSPQFFCGLAGYFVARLKRVPWVLEIRDLWPDSILAVGAVKNRALIRALERVEAWAYRNADGVVALTESFKDHIHEKGVPANRIEVITNGVDLDVFQPAPRVNSLSREWRIHDRFVVSYFGTMGMAHSLETVLEAADRLRDQKEILFLLVGDGADRTSLERMKDRMNLDNVRIQPPAPRNQMPLLWASSDAALVVLRKSDVFKTVIPSKMFEAMAMGVPVILGVQGESRRILESCRAGLGIEPENAEALAGAVLRLHADLTLGKTLGAQGRNCVETCYRREVLAEKYIRFLDRVV